MIRETISGAVTEYSKFYVPEGTRPRSSRRGKSSPRKQDQNDRDAAKRLARILNGEARGRLCSWRRRRSGQKGRRR